MKKYTSKIYGEINSPDSFKELLELLLQPDTDSYVPVMYWRGQSNIDWTIDSSSYRRLLNTKFYKGRKLEETDFIEYETSLLEQATHKGHRFQDGRKLTDFELLAKLQHHGSATRFVDFSRNLLVGLWFCVAGNLDKYGLLLGVHTSYIHGHENTLANDKYSDLIKKLKGNNSPTTWEPPVVSSRMAAQHAQFLFSEYSDNIYGSLKLPEKDESKLFVAISPQLKKESKIILESTFDLRTLTLFPDIDGFGMSNSHSVSRWDMDRW